MNCRGLIGALLPVMLLLVGCQSNAVAGYEYFEKVPEQGWSQGDEFFFSTKDLDPNKRYDILLVLRLKKDVPYRLLPLGITKEFPTRTFETKVLQVGLHSSDQPNSMRGFNITEMVSLVETNAHFPHNGVYTYSVRHLSTDSLVQGVMEVGLIIQPHVVL